MENSVDADSDETRQSNDSPGIAGMALTPVRRSVKYTNRKLLDGGKLLNFPCFLRKVLWFI